MTKYIALNDIGTFEVSDGSFGYWTTYEGDADGGLWIKSDGSNQGSWDYDEDTTDSGSWWNQAGESGTWTRDDTDYLLKHITVFTVGEYGGTVVNSDEETVAYWYLNATSDGGEWSTIDTPD